MTKRIDNPAKAIFTLKEMFSQHITTCLKDLLENKHLYQSVRINFSEEQEAFLKDADPRDKGNVLMNFLPFQGKIWPPIPPNQVSSGMTFGSPIGFKCPTIKLHCNTCDRREAYNPLTIFDISTQFSDSEGLKSKSGIVQVFYLSYLCQSCKGLPEFFLVRRDGHKLTLSGRSPIENVDVPKVIPKQVQLFFRGAIVAYQTGETLAANFYLRTLIEQWAQCLPAASGLQADEAIEAYMASLPDDFKSRFPSFRDLYSDLSAEIHKATGDPDLFEKSRKLIVEHFDARRLYKI